MVLPTRLQDSLCPASIIGSVKKTSSTFYKCKHMARVCVHPMCGSFEACITGAVIKVGVENVSEGKEKKKTMYKGRVCVGADEDYSEFCHL